MANTQQPAVLPDLGAISVSGTSGFGKRTRKLWVIAKRNKLGMIGVLLVAFVLFVSIFSPLLQRYDDLRAFETANPDFNPTATALDIINNPGKNLSTPTTLNRFEGPSSEHWLGTDGFGRDIYARIIVGARLAVIIGIGASIIAVILGTTTGLVSGYYGGKTDLAIQRVVDAVQAFPGLVLLLLIVSIMDQPNLAITVIALGFLGWATSVRIVRSAVLAISQAPFVDAARSYGAPDSRILMRHVLPNVMASVIVIFSISIGAYILAEAGLSFLGLGPADKTTWGKMVNGGRFVIDSHPWESMFAGGAITLAVLGFNLAGDAIRDELDPRLRGR